MKGVKKVRTVKVGDKIKMLTVLRILPNAIAPCGAIMTMVECLCECGNIKSYIYGNIKWGTTSSCGCFQKNRTHPMFSHGLSKHPLVRIWSGIKTRCYNKKSPSYKYYGRVGVIMCNEWLNSFESFYDWCMENGWVKGLEIDRFPNNKGNYEPTNCRIVTGSVNCRNTKRNVLITFEGLTKTRVEWSEIKGIPYQTLYNRQKRGCCIDELFKTKI